MTISRKITIPFIAFLLLTMIVTATFLYVLSARMEKTATQSQSIGGAIEVSRGLNIILAQALRQSELLASMSSVSAMLRHSPSTSPSLPDNDCSHVRELLQFTVAVSDATDIMSVITTQGEVVCSSSPLTEGTQRQDRRYFQSALQDEPVMEGPLTSRANGRPVVTLSSPIKINGQVAGVLSCSLGLEKMNAALTKKMSVQRAGSVYVLSSRGQVIIHPQHNMLLSNDLFPAERVTQMLENGQGMFTRERDDGQTARVAYVALKNPEWIVLYEDTLEHLPRIPLARNIGLLGVTLPLLAALVFFAPAMWRIRRDIHSLTLFAQRNVSQHNLEAETPDQTDLPLLLQPTAKRRDELGDLARSMFALSQDRDFAQQKAQNAMEEALRSRKDLFKITACMDGIGGGVAALRMATDITLIWGSQGYFRLFGLTGDSSNMDTDANPNIAFTQNPLRSVHPDDIATLDDILTTATRQQSLVSATFRIIQEDGTPLSLNMRGTIVENESEIPIFLAAFMPTSMSDKNDLPWGDAL